MKSKKLIVLLSAFIIIGIISYGYLSYVRSQNKATVSNLLDNMPANMSYEANNDILKTSQNQATTNTVTQTTIAATQTAVTVANTSSEKSQPVTQPKVENPPVKPATEVKPDPVKPATETKPDPAKQEELKNAIVGKYQSKFLALKNQSIGALNTLLAQAKAELNSLPEDKRSQAKVSLAIKYVNLGTALESECDSRFYALLSQMEQELKSNGLSTEAVSTAKSQYSAEKSERRSILMSKAF